MYFLVSFVHFLCLYQVAFEKNKFVRICTDFSLPLLTFISPGAGSSCIVSYCALSDRDGRTVTLRSDHRYGENRSDVRREQRAESGHPRGCAPVPAGVQDYQVEVSSMARG